MTKAGLHNWFGNCRVCGNETNLSTIRVDVENGIMTYWIKRSCDDCLREIKTRIDEALTDRMAIGRAERAIKDIE